MVVSAIAALKEQPFGIHTLKEGRLNVTPVFAAHILDELNYEGQRGVSASHVAFLADHIRRGTFRPGTQIAFARFDGRLYLTNGQHRLHAVVESGRPVEFQVLIQEIDTKEQLAALYYTFDRGGRARSNADVLASVGIVDRFGIPKHVAARVWQAYPILVSNFENGSISKSPSARNDDVRISALEPWWPLAAEFYERIGAAPRWAIARLISAPAIAIGMATFKYQPGAAKAFWGELAEDNGLLKGDPRKTLLTDMAGRSWQRQSLEGCLVVAAAWNAFFEGRPLGHIKIHTNSRVRLAGTPIGRGR